MFDMLKGLFGWFKDRFRRAKEGINDSKVPVISGFLAGLWRGAVIALGLFAVAWVLEFLNYLTCGFFPYVCGGACFRCDLGGRSKVNRIFTSGCENFPGVGIFSIWNKHYFFNTLIFCTVTGIVIGAIYGIAKQVQRNANDPVLAIRRKEIGKANTAVINVKNKADNIVSLIKNAEETIASPEAKRLIQEASVAANSSALALEKAVEIAENVKGKSSIKALRIAREAKYSAEAAVKKEADDFFNQAMQEEQDWNRLQKEADDAVNKAKNAADNAAKEAAKIEKTAFASAAAKDAAEKAAYASAKAQEAAEKTVKRGEAAARAASAQEAQIEVTMAKHSEKRAMAEAKIALEEAGIAVEVV